MCDFSITYQCVDELQRKPSREGNNPYIDLYQPQDVTLNPGEKACFSLGVVLTFPADVCGLVHLKDSAGKKMVVRMSPTIYGT